MHPVGGCIDTQNLGIDGGLKNKVFGGEGRVAQKRTRTVSDVNGVFHFDFGQLLFVGSVCWGVRVIYMYLLQTAGQFTISSKVEA